MSAIGLRVGPFEILEEVVVPGTGSWYRARRTALGRRQPAEVLVRLLGPSPSPRELAGVQRQYDALSTLNDRHFPRAIAMYEGSGAMAVEASPAVGLGRVIEARLLGDLEMTPSTLLDLALEITDALSHAHQHGMFHGHLSADDVALSADGAVWVWGMGEPDVRPPFAWLPPERARSEAPSAATDQWSLAALLVALVTGRPPWSSSSIESDPRTGDVDGFLEPLARQWPALGRLARRMLDPNPALRFPTLHPVRLELLQLARRAGGSSERRMVANWLHRGVDAQEPVAATRAPIEAPPRPRATRPKILSLPSAAVHKPLPAVTIPIHLDDAAGPDDVATEMFGTEAADDASSPGTPVPPVRSAARATASIPEPGRAWIDEPTPTLPGMDVVEPAALHEGPSLRLSVPPGPSLRPEPRIMPMPPVPTMDLDEDLRVDDDRVEVLVELDPDEFDPPEAEPQPFVVAVPANEEDDDAPVPVEVELEVEVEVEHTEEEPMVAFTDPVFVSPWSEEDGHHPLAAPPGADAPAPVFPWLAPEELTLPESANQPIVRFAPWLASAAMVGLALLTVLNVAF